MNRSETHLVESEERFRRDDFAGALEECNAALTAAETISVGFRGSYAARLALARAIQERAVALEELDHVVDSLRERSLAEGVLQDAILEFPQVPELFFTLSWVQSQFGAAKFRLGQSTSEVVAHYRSAIESLTHIRDEEVYQPEVLQLLALFELFLMNALQRDKKRREIYAHTGIVFDLVKEIRVNDPENPFPFELIDRIAFLNSGMRGRLLKKIWYSSMK
jgi:hypothetical protein